MNSNLANLGEHTNRYLSCVATKAISPGDFRIRPGLGGIWNEALLHYLINESIDGHHTSRYISGAARGDFEVNNIYQNFQQNFQK